MLLLNVFFSFCLLSNLGGIAGASHEITVPSPKVIKPAYTNFPEKNNWVTIPMGTKEITISVESENTETVLFWLIPTGTQTWYERRLIGYDINRDKENKFNKTHKFSLTWKIDRPFLHDHLEVELIGMNEVINGGSINIRMDRLE